jgi:hypothetical protein
VWCSRLQELLLLLPTLWLGQRHSGGLLRKSGAVLVHGWPAGGSLWSLPDTSISMQVLGGP